MDKVFAIQNDQLYVNQGGWHECMLVGGCPIKGEPARNLRPRELFNSHEVRTKLGMDYPVAEMPPVSPDDGTGTGEANPEDINPNPDVKTGEAAPVPSASQPGQATNDKKE